MSTLLLLTLAYMAVAATIYGALLRLHKPKETFGSVFLDLTIAAGWGLAGPVLAGDALMGWWLGRQVGKSVKVKIGADTSGFDSAMELARVALESARAATPTVIFAEECTGFPRVARSAPRSHA